MANNSILKQKGEDFAVRIVNCYKYLLNSKNEKTLSMQMLRSGTSIGANICEALDAQSRKDFINKLSISLKENHETQYWLNVLFRSDYIDYHQYQSMTNDNEEIKKIIIATIKTTKQNGL